MTTDELKNLLKDFREMETWYYFVVKQRNLENSASGEIGETGETVELLSAAMKILDERERFIITNHLVLHYTWPEIIAKMSECFGINNSRSERTLKRIQNRALEKMLLFIGKIN